MNIETRKISLVKLLLETQKEDILEKIEAIFKNLSPEKTEDIEDVLLYDEAKKEDDGERVSFSEYLAKRKKSA